MRTKPKPSTTHILSHTIHQEHNLSWGFSRPWWGLQLNQALRHPQTPTLPVLIWANIATSKAEVSGLLVNHLQNGQIFSLKVIQNHGSGISKYFQKKVPVISADYRKLFSFEQISNMGKAHPSKYFFVEIMWRNKDWTKITEKKEFCIFLPLPQ